VGDADASMWPLKGSAISGYVPRDGESPRKAGSVFSDRKGPERAAIGTSGMGERRER
jgi:hypothetical protein